MDDVATALELTENDFAPIAWNGGLYQDKRYGIPLDVHPAGLFYNKTVMEKAGADPEKPPTTGDELMAILDQCKSKGIQGMWTSALSVNGLLVADDRVPVRREDGQRRRPHRGVRAGAGLRRPSRGGRA